MADFEHRYATVNGVKLHYAACGTGPVMLFVHGFPEFWYAWKDQLPEFGKDHRAVAVDMRGFNLSDKPVGVENYRHKHIVEDLRQLIDHLGGAPVIVVAHDWGGAIAWNLAIRYPNYISKFIVINAVHPAIFARNLKNDPEQIAASQYITLLRSEKAERVMSENNYGRLQQMITGDSERPWWTEQDLARYREAWAQPGAMTASLNYYRSTPLHPTSAEAPGAAALDLDLSKFIVKVPTLVIWGERDRALRPSSLDGLDQVVPDLTIKRIPEGTHWVAHEYPEQVNTYIRDFIANKR